MTLPVPRHRNERDFASIFVLIFLLGGLTFLVRNVLLFWIR